jgi:hypothetical protein
MATGAYKTGGPKAALGNSAGASEREDLSNYISLITRSETPFMSSIGKAKAKATLHEWQTDELRAPGENIRAEGVDFADITEATGFRSKLGNNTQIFAEVLSVSNTKRDVDQAGVADEYAYQLKKKGKEIRRDLEWTMVQSWQSRDGSTSTRKMGGVHAYADEATVWDAVASDFASAAASNFTDTFNANGTLVATDAANTEVSIDLADIDEVMQAIYQEGGNASRVMVSPKNRRTISEAAQLAGSQNVRRNIDDSGKLRSSIDIYQSDFGEVMIVPNYIMGTGGVDAAGPLLTGDNPDDYTAIVYDPQWFKLATLRPLAETDVGPKGDSTIGMLIEECTLEVSNPKGFGLIVGIGA